MRAVLDANVVISGVLSPAGAPAALLRGLTEGAFEAVVSPMLLAEVERALAYPKIRARIPEDVAAELLAYFARHATLLPDPADEPPVQSVDPDDDYVVALASSARAMIVSGDRHLLDLAPTVPVLTPAAFLQQLEP